MARTASNRLGHGMKMKLWTEVNKQTNPKDYGKQYKWREALPRIFKSNLQ